MRVKISFLKEESFGANGLVPIHHQRLLFDLIKELSVDIPEENKSVCFSSLKGKSNAFKEQIRFLSAKVNWIITSPHDETINTILRNLFAKKSITLESLTLTPKSYQVIGQPHFETLIKYICISPYIPYYQKGTDVREALSPETHEFSDRAFEFQILRMEHAGYSEKMLNAFAEFEIIPDLEYFKKVKNSANAFPRLYKNPYGEMVYGYIFPFTVHAHSELQKFIWENGIGQYTNEGYGMLDTVPETPPVSDKIVP
jgi:CRISPR-associated endoribonuclease Cas6